MLEFHTPIARVQGESEDARKVKATQKVKRRLLKSRRSENCSK